MQRPLLTLFALLLLIVHPAIAEEPAEGAEAAPEVNLQNPYFVALMNIQLRKNQTDKFKQLLNEYAGSRGKVVDRERRRNSPDLPGRIARAHVKVKRNFEKKMAKLLDTDQLTRFDAFHVELDKLLSEREVLTEKNDAENVFPRNT